MSIPPDELAKCQRRGRIANWVIALLMVGLAAVAVFGGPFRPSPYFPPVIR